MLACRFNRMRGFRDEGGFIIHSQDAAQGRRSSARRSAGGTQDARRRHAGGTQEAQRRKKMKRRGHHYVTRPASRRMRGRGKQDHGMRSGLHHVSAEEEMKRQKRRRARGVRTSPYIMYP